MARLTPAWLPIFALLATVALAESEEIAALRKKADAGDARAQYYLGGKFGAGDGVPKDFAEARLWYFKSAEQGFAPAQRSLGMFYWTGSIMPKDIVLAHVWYNLAAAQGDETARMLLVEIEKEMTPDQKAEAMKLAREMFEKMPKK